VTVCVGLDHRPQLGAVQSAQQGLGVAAQRAQIDGEFASQVKFLARSET
jgi:hypothetical protein